MSDKPTEVPAWATTGGATIIEPSGADKASGWVADEQPGAQHMNWLQNLAYQWSLWISDGYWTRSSLTDRTPLIASTDRDGRERHTLGPEGFWTGPAVNITYMWGPFSIPSQIAGDLVSQQGMYVVDITGASVVAPGVATTAAEQTGNGNDLLMQVNGTTSGSKILVSQEYNLGAPAVGLPIRGLDDTTVVLENRINISGVSQDIATFMGLHDFATISNLLASTNRCAMFYIAESSTDIRCVTADGGTLNNVSSGVTLTTQTVFTMRIELHGLNTPLGVDAGFAVAQYFIDGVLVHTQNDTDVPNTHATNGIGFCAALVKPANANAVTTLLSISTTKMAWSGTLDPDVPA